MNSTAASQPPISPPMEGIIEDFLKHFYIWELVKREKWGKNIYISFRTGVFNDLHAKQFQKIARLHGFRLVGYGIRPVDAGKLLVTFVLIPKRGDESK